VAKITKKVTGTEKKGKGIENGGTSTDDYGQMERTEKAGPEDQDTA
jgi:hypothetical protein